MFLRDLWCLECVCFSRGASNTNVVDLQVLFKDKFAFLVHELSLSIRVSSICIFDEPAIREGHELFPKVV